MKNLTEDEISELTTIMDQVITTYGLRDTMMQRYEEIYFMTRPENPQGMKIDEKDIKTTISSSGRNAVTGLKRILDTSKVHIKLKDGSKADKMEDACRQILDVSGEFKADIEKDVNLSSILYGPAVVGAESVDDILAAKKGSGYVDEYVRMQLQEIKKRTPFILRAINARQSYPIWGQFGMVGHVWKRTMKGSEIKEQWGTAKVSEKNDYVVRDCFYYSKRLIRAEGVADPLYACEWVSRDKAGKIIGSINIPVFVRYAGGTSLFHEPDKQMQPLLYAMAKGNWDLRQNLFWTYVFTAIFMQGLPGPTFIQDPDDPTTSIEIKYDKGVKIIKGKGKLENIQIIDGNVIQLKNLIDEENAMSTIQPQTLGQNTEGVTYSQFAMASKAGLIPAQDPKEAQEAMYKDAFTYILRRIKDEGIENDLIAPEEIPDKFELVVTIEPDLAQDDLRNSQIATGLKEFGVSDEFINTTILKIADSKAMFKQKTVEDVKKAMVASILSNPQYLQPYIVRALGQQKQTPTTTPTAAGPGGPPAGPNAMPEPIEKTDAMVPEEERM